MLYFHNPGSLDIRALTTFGLSAKDTSKNANPIGFFGTGLKYAIAVAVRECCSLSLLTDGEVYTFEVVPTTFRGKEFSALKMHATDGTSVELPFTLDLGRNWSLWMAYRELFCNAKDEGGGVATRATASADTLWSVDSPAMEAVHAERHKYFLESEPRARVGLMEIHDNPGQQFFYKGVLVHTSQKPWRFTYNMGQETTLTEDRTMADSYALPQRVAKAILQCTDAPLISEALGAANCEESVIDYHGWGVPASKEFLAVVGARVQSKMLLTCPSAIKVWEEATKQKAKPQPAALSIVQKNSLARALAFCTKIGYPIATCPFPVVIADSLGPNGLGLAYDNTIYVSIRVFESGGTKALASTLIEEYLHLKEGYHDMTRELQTYLFDKVVSLGEELQGEAL